MNISDNLNKFIIRGADLITVSFIKNRIESVSRASLAKLAVSMGVGSLVGSYLKQKDIQLKTIIKYSAITASTLALGAAALYSLPSTRKVLSLKALGHLKRSLFHTATFVTGAVLPSLHALAKFIFESMQKAYTEINTMRDGPAPGEPTQAGNPNTQLAISCSGLPHKKTDPSNTLAEKRGIVRLTTGNQLQELLKINPNILYELLTRLNSLQHKAPIIVTITTPLQTGTVRIDPKILARFLKIQNGFLKNPSLLAIAVSSRCHSTSSNSEPAGDRIKEVTEKQTSLDLIKDALRAFQPNENGCDSEYVKISKQDVSLEQEITSSLSSCKKTIDEQPILFQSDIEKYADLKDLIRRLPDIEKLAEEIQLYVDGDPSLEDLATKLVSEYSNKLVKIFEKGTHKSPGSDELSSAGDALMSLQKNTKLHIAIRDIYNHLSRNPEINPPPQLTMTLLQYASFFSARSLLIG